MFALTPLLALAMASAGPATPPANPTRNAPVTEVVVQNDETVPVTVYVEWGSQELRLGKVAAMDTASLEIPQWLVTSEADLDIYVHPQRGFDQETGILEIHRGDTIGVIVPSKAHGEPRQIDIEHQQQ